MSQRRLVLGVVAAVFVALAGALVAAAVWLRPAHEALSEAVQCGACDGLAAGAAPSPSMSVAEPADAEPAREPGPPDRQALESGLGGKDVVAVLENPERGWVIRTSGNGGWWSPADFPRIGDAVRIPPDTLRRLSAILIDDRSWSHLGVVGGKGCMPDYGVHIQLERRRHVVNLFLCFRCAQSAIYLDGSSVGHQDFDPAAPKLAAIVDELLRTPAPSAAASVADAGRGTAEAPPEMNIPVGPRRGEIRPLRAKVESRLDKVDGVVPEGVERVLSAARGRVRGCYQAGLNQGASFSGRAAFVVQVDGDGRASSVVTKDVRGIPHVVASCSSGVLRSLSFEPPGGGKGASLHLTLLFAAEERTSPDGGTVDAGR